MSETTLDMAITMASDYSDEVREKLGVKLIEQLQDNDPVLGDFMSRLESDPAFAARVDAALARGEADIEAGRATSADMLTAAVIRQRIADDA